MDAMIAQVNPWIIAAVLAAAMLGSWVLGWSIGCKNPGDPDDKPSARFIEGSLALLALLLGFTFAMALTKHEQRRLMIIADANAISDFYTTTGFLPEPQRTGLQDTIREYVNARLNLAQTSDDALVDSEKLQQRMTDLAQEAVHADTPLTLPLVNTFNNLTSCHSSLVSAIRDRLPAEVLLLLAATAIISTILVARYHGTRHKLHMSGTISYVLLVSLAVCVILDLNQPTRGLTTVSVEPLQRVAASIAK